jgi:hypothetical protein
MQIDPQLRERLSRLRQKGKEIREQLAAEKLSAAAEEILAVLEIRARHAALNQETTMCAMKCGWEHYNYSKPPVHGSPDPQWLLGVARLVFDECEKAGLQPFLTWQPVFDQQIRGCPAQLLVKI